MADHDIHYPRGTQSVAVTSALGASTTVFGTQTREYELPRLAGRSIQTHGFS
jgi:hypothetical protein